MRAYQKDFSMINVLTSSFNAANRAVHAMKTRLACLSIAGAMTAANAGVLVMNFDFKNDDRTGVIGINLNENVENTAFKNFGVSEEHYFLGDMSFKEIAVLFSDGQSFYSNTLSNDLLGGYFVVADDIPGDAIQFVTNTPIISATDNTTTLTQ